MWVPDPVGAVVRREFPGAEIRGVERFAGGCKATYRVAESACLHFDYAPGNVLARGDEVVGVVDWGFAVAGHAEYDLFAFEKSVLLAELDSPAVRDGLRPHVYAGYCGEDGLEPGWERRRVFYRVVLKLASMWSFPRWTGSAGEEERDELAGQLRDELRADLERLRASER